MANKVEIIHRRDELRATRILQERVFDSDKVEMVWDTIAVRFSGLFGMDTVTLQNVKNGEERDLKVDGCFVWVGVEPNTAFHARPPRLPAEDDAWEMQSAGAGLLRAAGLENYEVSAWARPGSACRHNLNYWRYGDFIGIGAGAHGKLTLAADNAVRRRIRLRHPRAWMEAAEQGEPVAEDRAVTAPDRVFEFFLNQLRLREGVRIADFSSRTGLPWATAASANASVFSRASV